MTLSAIQTKMTSDSKQVSAEHIRLLSSHIIENFPDWKDKQRFTRRLQDSIRDLLDEDYADFSAEDLLSLSRHQIIKSILERVLADQEDYGDQDDYYTSYLKSIA